MSAANGTEVLRPILLRSTTPASNEKVLNYLEGMAREDTDPMRPASTIMDPHEDAKSRISHHPPRSIVHSPVPRSHHSEALQDLANSPVSYGNGGAHIEADDDMDSNAQQRSEPDEVPLPIREPGPSDPPGPRYESYDSGPSFGNKGPLPTDDYYSSFPPNFSTWTPEWNQPSKPSGLGLDTGWVRSPNAHKVPLPESVMASPKPTSVNIGIESPSTTSKHQSQARTNKTRSMASEVKSNPASKKVTSRAQSPLVQTPTDSSDSPLSPPLSRKSHITGRTQGTAYPALPESRFGDDDTNHDRVASPTKSKAHTHHSKVASVAGRSQGPQANGTDASALPRGTNQNGRQQTGVNGTRSPPASVFSGHQSRPFSPYRHAPTQEDLLHAATRGRALFIPDNDDRKSTKEKSRSRSPSKVTAAPQEPLSPPLSPQLYKPPKAPSMMSWGAGKQASVAGSARTGVSKATRTKKSEKNLAPTSRPHTPLEELSPEEKRIVQEALTNGLTPRTSYYSPSSLDGDAAMNSQYHDGELCVLFTQLNSPDAHEVVKRALRKAVRHRVRKLGMKDDNESIKELARHHSHDHVPTLQTLAEEGDGAEPPLWAADMKRELVLIQQRIESLGPKIENLQRAPSSHNGEDSKYYEGGEDYTHTPHTQSVNIHTQPTGTLAGSMYMPPDTEIIMEDDEDDGQQEYPDDRTETQHGRPDDVAATRSVASHSRHTKDREDSPGQQYLEEELYKLRQRKANGSLLSWEVAREGAEEPEEEEEHEYDEEPLDLEEDEEDPAGIPTIPSETRATSPPLPPIPQESGERGLVTTPRPWASGDYGNEAGEPLLPWQKIHQRLLTWAITWPMNAIESALNSTTRGHQVDEVALSIWSTQTYKRYVRSRLTDRPKGVVDRLFVPPNVADAISNAVFHGRHGDACGMLRDLWSPFGLEGMPRLLVVLAKHRTDENHWVVHRFSLPDGSLTTYDTYPERTLPDGRPLGWWFAIRVAWPNAIYPSPDHLMQKMVRLHRPMQLPIDNSVSAAGIWRNILMGSRAERGLDLERLRDLVNTEVKNLRQRKLMGKLAIPPLRPAWEDMN